ncbi:MAG: acyl-CoA dehydrogenase [Gammaproteobacteria bacterium]|nr:MAG: acyl-CoA dehydrogenase [Pseudomonadota bacterium]PIE38803.1 MAG: acyl-CoA dehydrogenase [Gammaproteobacteria bacterium]
MNLEVPGKFQLLIEQARQVANEVFRPISRKYDKLEHHYPVELDMLASIVDGMNDGAAQFSVGASKLHHSATDKKKVNGATMATILGLQELCRGDVALALSLPRQGLGNAVIAAMATDEQRRKFGHLWAAVAVTEPDSGSDAESISTMAVEDETGYTINGEKIFVTAGQRCDAVVVWATLDKSKGRGAIKPFVVLKKNPGLFVERLERKLGIKASDTATIRFTDCHVPKESLLGDADADSEKSFSAIMQTWDDTRPVVAAMAVGLAMACLERTRKLLGKAGLKLDYGLPSLLCSSVEAEIYSMEAELEAARLLTLKAAWMADNGLVNSKEAAMAKVKAGKMVNDVCLKCVEICGAAGYQEDEFIEKWARDSKALDIFGGTRQVQQLVIARKVLNKTSSDLK